MTPLVANIDFTQASPSVRKFFSGDEEALAVIRTPALPATAQGRVWNQQGVDTEGLKYWALGYFQTIVSYFLYALCMPNYSKRLWVDSRHSLYHATEAETFKVFQNNLITTSINAHRRDAVAHYSQPATQTALRIRPQTRSLNFFQDSACYGMCHWYVHLFFRTRAYFSDPQHHVKAVGKQFELGAPNQATVLQGLDIPEVYNLLRIQARFDHAKIPTAGKNHDQLTQQLQQRSPGVYGIYTSSHQVVFIKLNEMQQFLFDPLVGVIKVNTPLLFQTAMKRYFASHNTEQEIIVDLYTQR